MRHGTKKRRELFLYDVLVGEISYLIELLRNESWKSSFFKCSEELFQFEIFQLGTWGVNLLDFCTEFIKDSHLLEYCFSFGCHYFLKKFRMKIYLFFEFPFTNFKSYILEIFPERNRSLHRMNGKPWSILAYAYVAVTNWSVF